MANDNKPLTKKDLETLKEFGKEQEKTNKKVDAGTKSIKKQAEASSSLIKNLLGLGGVQVALTGISKLAPKSFQPLISNLKAAAMPLNSVLKNMQEIQKVAGIPTPLSMLADSSKIVAMSDSVDALTSGLKASTIGGRDFTGSLKDLIQSTAQFGVKSDEVKDAIAELYKSNQRFSEFADKKSVVTLSKMALLLKKAGVAFGTTGELTNVFSARLGMGAQKSAQFLEKISQIGMNLNVNLPQAFANFKSSYDRLILTGIDKMTNRFSRLQGAVKATGVSMGTLINSLGKSTDTFEGSVGIATKLNAMLGTNISSMKLLAGNAEQNLSTIVTAFQKSGKTFEQLGKFQQLFLSETLRVKPSELKGLLSKSPVALEMAMLRGELGAAKTGDLAKRVQDATTRKAKLEAFADKRMFDMLDKLATSLRAAAQQSVMAVQQGTKAFGPAMFQLLQKQFIASTQASFKASGTLLKGVLGKTVDKLTALAIRRIKATNVALGSVLISKGGGLAEIGKVLKEAYKPAENAAKSAADAAKDTRVMAEIFKNLTETIQQSQSNKSTPINRSKSKSDRKFGG